jgi:hypothetical protein
MGVRSGGGRQHRPAAFRARPDNPVAYAATLQPQRAPALRHPESSAPMPVAPVAKWRKFSTHDFSRPWMSDGCYATGIPSKIGPVHGPYHQQLNSALCDCLGVTRLSPFANGTMPLVNALQTLRIMREILTTTVFLRRHRALAALEQYPPGILRY